MKSRCAVPLKGNLWRSGMPKELVTQSVSTEQQLDMLMFHDVSSWIFKFPAKPPIELFQWTAASLGIFQEIAAAIACRQEQL